MTHLFSFVFIITRSKSLNTVKTSPGHANSAAVDLTDVAKLPRIFLDNHIEVVLSTVPSAGLAAQRLLADAAKAADVKLFVPSEFGLPTIGMTKAEGDLVLKEAFAG